MAHPAFRLLAALLVLAVAITAISEPFLSAFTVSQTLDAHIRPDVGASAFGTYVFVWQDSTTKRVVHRRYNSSGSVSSELPVGDVVSDEEWEPRVAVRPDGSFFVVWWDSTAGSQHVHGRRFGSSGAPLAPEFRVSTTDQVQPALDIATAPSGTSLVVWKNSADGSAGGISGQRFASSGAPIAAEFRVNTTTVNDQMVPRVAATGQSGFVAVWRTDMGGGNTDIRAQIFNAAGQPVGGEIPVNAYTAGDQRDPAVAADVAGNFVVAWASLEHAGDNSLGVYAQRFTASGAPLGFEFRVNTATPNAQEEPAVFVDSQGRMVFTYHDTSDSALYREFARDGSPKAFGEIAPPGENHSHVPIDGPPDGNAVAVWYTPSNRIWARFFVLSPDPIGAEFRVNTQTTGYQTEPAVAGNLDGSFVVAWASQRDPAYAPHDVKVQRFSPTNAPVGFETLASDPFYNSHVPGIASSANGDFVVVWSSASFAFSQLVHRRYSASGTALGGIVPVEDFAGAFDVARSAAGPFAIVWSGGSDIRARLYASSGAPAGSIFRVNTTADGEQGTPRIAVDGAGNFVVVWTSGDGSGLGIFGQRLSASGQSLGPEFRVNPSTLLPQEEPDVAAFPDGGFVVAWRDGEPANIGIQARRFTSSGEPAPPAILFVNMVTTGRQERPRVAAREDGFVIVWRSIPSYKFVKAQLYGKSGARVGGEFQVGPVLSGFFDGYADAAFAGQDLVVVWRGYDPLPVVPEQKQEIRAQRIRVRFCTAGDVNGDGVVNVTDVLFLINHLFAGGPLPTSCANANGDASTNVTDVLYLINYLFAGGPVPI